MTGTRALQRGAMTCASSLLAVLVVALAGLTAPAPALAAPSSPARVVPTTHPAGSVWGVVRDDEVDLEPKAGVTLTLQRWDGATKTFVTAGTTTSDADGYYEFTGLATGTYTVVYPVAGATENNESLRLTGDGASAPAVYQSSDDLGSRWVSGYLPQGDIEGEGVVRGHGSIVLQRWDSSSRKWVDLRLTYDGFYGEFTFHRLPAGTYKVDYRWTGGTPAKYAGVAAAGISLRDSRGRGITLSPRIKGTPAAGAKLTALPGSVAKADKVSYRWFRDFDREKFNKAISKKKTYRPTRKDVGTSLSMSVTANIGKAGYTLYSAGTADVARAGTPRISGRPVVGRTLKAAPGAWTSGTTYSYRWYANGRPVAGATSPSLTLTTKQRGKAIKVKVTGRKSGYATITKTSAATRKVR